MFGLSAVSDATAAQTKNVVVGVVVGVGGALILLLLIALWLNRRRRSKTTFNTFKPHAPGLCFVFCLSFVLFLLDLWLGFAGAAQFTNPLYDTTYDTNGPQYAGSFDENGGGVITNPAYADLPTAVTSGYSEPGGTTSGYSEPSSSTGYMQPVPVGGYAEPAYICGSSNGGYSEPAYASKPGGNAGEYMEMEPDVVA